jgi:hypothetical protein
MLEGSLAAFQPAIDSAARRALGAHYTSESNILKLLRPLFLDALEAELAACGTSQRRLQAFHEKLGRLGFLDPACGCGNFLVIAYRELRRLERETIERLQTTDLDAPRQVSLDQFAGIELDESAARMAEATMPGARIEVGNALRVDWNEAMPAEECSYVLGNPPYAGKHLLSGEQRQDMDRVLGPHRHAGSLDYASAWLIRAAEYTARNPAIGAAFVTTNSITQGEQVPALWPLLHALGVHVTFGWRTFNWTSEDRGAAHVHVVIVGFRRAASAPPATLYEYEPKFATSIARRTPPLNGYLAPGPEVYPAARSGPIDPGIPPVVYGAKPADGGHLLLTREEAALIRAEDPIAATFIRPIMSATEFLNGGERFCLWLEAASPMDIERSPVLNQRLAAVRDFRLSSAKPQTQRMAATPGLFAEVRRPGASFIFIPRHASAARRLIPMGLVPADRQAVVHDSGAYIEGADLALFGLLQSEMFAAWQRTVGGRIKSDYRFNNRLVYNTFPFPDRSEAQHAEIAAAAEEVLAARAAHPDATLSELYSPVSAPPDLLQAHRRLDHAVEAAFGRRGQLTEPDRLATLFGRYEQSAGRSAVSGPRP